MADESLKISCEAIAPGIQILRIAGSVDSRTHTQLADAMNRAVSEGCVNLVMDLEHLEHIASAGVGVLVEMLSLLEQKGGDLVVVHLRPELKGGALKLVGLLDVIKTADNVDAALTMLNKSHAK